MIDLDLLGEDHLNVAVSYHNLGLTSRKTKNYDRALSYYLKALAIREKQPTANSRACSDSYSSIANLYADLGQHDKSIEYHEKSINILRKIYKENHPFVAKEYNNIVIPYLKKNNYEKAIEMCKKSLAAIGYSDETDFLDVGYTYELNTSFYLLSKTNLERYKNTQNADFLKQGLEWIDKAHKNAEYHFKMASNDEDKIMVNDSYRDLYEIPIKIYQLSPSIEYPILLKDFVFDCFEKIKAALLHAQIKASEALIFSDIPAPLLQQERNLRIDLSWREKQRQSLLEKGLAETDTTVLRIASILFDLRQQHDALKQRFEQEFPEYYRLKYDLSTVPLGYVQDTLLAPDQALLEYFVGDSSIYLFLVRPDTFAVHEVKRDFPLEDWIEQFRQGLYGYHTAPEDQRTTALYERCLAQYLEFAPKLCEKLVAPVAALLPENVILVPDGPLGYIPFDALLSAAPKDLNNFKAYPYLLRRHQFSYTYSATLLREMRDKKHRREPEKPFCAFAPFYTGDTLVFERDYAFVSRRGFDPLPHTKDEVGRARQEMGGDIVSGASATEQRFVETAGQYRILHLATHGVADNRLGDYAYLAFSDIPDSIENELLYVRDLYNLQLNADLVVLSACETGVGKLRRGEGIISLARAFAYAGAKSIVTSLWQVNSQSTSELMKLFYAELKAGKTKDAALRSARTAYIRQATVKGCHPFYWAGFVPVGDMRALR